MAEDKLIRDLDRISELSISRIRECAFHLERNYNVSRGIQKSGTFEELNGYIFGYWPMHNAKQQEALNILLNVKKEYFLNEVNIIDWGCGQGLATLSYLEFLRSKGLPPQISSLTFIDAWPQAVKRAEYLCKRFAPNLEPFTIIKDLNQIEPSMMPKHKSSRTIHFLSNILDVEEIDLSVITSCLLDSQCDNNLFVCISPFIYQSRNARLDSFADYYQAQFAQTYSLLSRRVCSKEETCRSCPKFIKTCNAKFRNRDWARHEVLFEVILPRKAEPRIIDFPPIYIPPVKAEPARTFIKHYQAAYAPDPIIAKSEYSKLSKYIASNSHFTLSSKSIKEDQYSQYRSEYSVLANQIMRGLPTYLPIDLAERMAQELQAMEELEPLYGTLRFGLREEWPQDFISLAKPQRELIITGIGIARLQLCVLIYLIHKEVKANELEIQVVGGQDQASRNAVDSLNLMLANMGVLTGKALPVLSLIQEPKVDSVTEGLIIHLRNSPETKLPESGCDIIAVDVLDQEFYDAQYQRRYFSAKNIEYRRFYDDQSETYDAKFISALRYFLQTLFRKKDFIEGQLGILRHSLRLYSVIGLLPTGGGKSLIYQLSSLLQPGFSLVVEPIRSLMKDQYDEMQLIGIDSSYINSDNSKDLNNLNMMKMQTGQTLFTLISPERMQIQEFRDALMDMVAEDNFFSYFIVDEAHCVSEWGHDFRPSYLSLAANANKFCKPFDAKDITVIGLTATASFDVLTDVQAELEINTAKKIQIEKSPSLKREEIIYRFIPVEYSKEDLTGWKLTNRVRSAKRDILTNLLKNSLEEDINSANKMLGKNNKYSLGCEDQANIEIGNDTGIIVFCPHRAGLLGVNVYKDDQKTEDGTFEHLEKELGKEQKIKAGYYRGGSDPDDRQEQRMIDDQQKFKTNKINLMIATKAFGMGFNKPNVRFSVHLNFPGSIEGFAQETGRVGRDRKLALSYLLYSDLDEGVPGFLHEKNYPGIEKEIELTRKIMGYKNQDGKSINDVLKDHDRTQDFVIEIASTADDLGKIIYRLALVGIIDDYTIRYGYPLMYKLYVEAKDRRSLNTTLKTYLLRYYSEKQANVKVAEFALMNGGKPNYTDLIRYYIQFEYDFIKLKRKQAIKDMDFASRYGLENQEHDPLSENFREYIDVYFSSKYFRENYMVDGEDASITRVTDRGKIESEGIVSKFINIVKKDTGGLIPNSKELRGACIRLLNDNPRNYSLHILNAFTNLILSRKKALEINHLEFNQGIKELIQGVGLYMRGKGKLTKFDEFSALLKSFWQSINEEIPEFESHMQEMTGQGYQELEQLLYLNRSAEILARMIKEEK